MLVLSDTDWFRVDFNQFCKRIHQSSSYWNCSPYCNIIIGKLIPCCLRSWIDRCSSLAYNKYLNILFEFNPFNKLFGFATGSTITDCNGLDLIGIYKREDFLDRHRSLILRCMGINGFIMQQVSLAVETNKLAACPESGIQSQNILLTQRRSEEQLP